MKVKRSDDEILVQDSPIRDTKSHKTRTPLPCEFYMCVENRSEREEDARMGGEGRDDEESQRVVEESGRECRVFATWQVLSFVLRPPSFLLASESFFFLFQGERRHLFILLFVDRPLRIFSSSFSIYLLSQFLGLCCSLYPFLCLLFSLAIGENCYRFIIPDSSNLRSELRLNSSMHFLPRCYFLFLLSYHVFPSSSFSLSFSFFLSFLLLCKPWVPS